MVKGLARPQLARENSTINQKMAVTTVKEDGLNVMKVNRVAKNVLT